MIHIQQSTVINQPVENVFSYVTDIEKLPQWAGEIVEARVTSDGPVDVGTTWTGVIKALGRKMENLHEISEYEQNRKFSMRIISGPVTGEATYSFETLGNGTKIGVMVDAELGGFFKVADPIVSQTLQKQYETNLANLKEVLEAQDYSR